MTDWQPRLLVPGEEPALLELLLAAFGTWPKSEISVDAIDHLRWKLEAGGDQRAAVVEADGAIVGAVLISFRELLIKRHLLRGTSGGDVAVHPTHQGKRMFTAMTPFLWDLSMATSDISYGYRSRNLAVQKTIQRFKRSIKRSIFGNFVNVLVTSARSAAPAAAQAEEPWQLCGVTTFDERIDALWRDAAPQFDFIASRTRDFLNWRFCDRRAGDYTVVVAEQDGRILGYTVERVSNGRGYLVDLLTLPGRLDVAFSLARRAVDGLRGAGVDEVDCWLPSRHSYFDALSEAGFATLKTTQDVTYRPLQTAAEELSFLLQPEANIHFTLGDTDLV